MTEPMGQQKTCSKCGEAKPPGQFYRDVSKRDGLSSRCRHCVNESDRRRRQENLEHGRENGPWRQKTCSKCGETKPPDQFNRDARARDGLGTQCRACRNEAGRRWHQENQERAHETHQRWIQENPERKNEYYRQYHAQMRAAVLDHYGRECACCGTADDLSIDHVNGDGKEHRAEIAGSGSGSHMYAWLIRNGFPDGFQTLCWPCNRAKGQDDRCPLDHAAAKTA